MCQVCFVLGKKVQQLLLCDILVHNEENLFSEKKNNKFLKLPLQTHIEAGTILYLWGFKPITTGSQQKELLSSTTSVATHLDGVMGGQFMKRRRDRQERVYRSTGGLCACAPVEPVGAVAHRCTVQHNG